MLQETSTRINIAVEGCFHGEADKVYDVLSQIEKTRGIKIDVLLVCGDFQSFRNAHDMHNMACPKKYLQMGSFHKYYTGEKVAPCLTIFIGGNHEASNYLREMYFGGWVAPNIYFLGSSNVIKIKKGTTELRLGGISGIFKVYDFNNARMESLPFDETTSHNVYHTKQIDVVKFLLYDQPIDIFLSHDWPQQIYYHGNTKELLQKKKHFAQDIKNDRLGSPVLKLLLKHLKPSYWYAAHMHVKFEAVVQHQGKKVTKQNQSFIRFLSLDKCLPNRDFLQLIQYSNEGVSFDFENWTAEPVELIYDEEWLKVVSSTYKLITIWDKMPKLFYFDNDLKEYRHTNREKFDELKAETILKQTLSTAIPNNFKRTAQPFDPYDDIQELVKPSKIPLNNQMIDYLAQFNESGLELNGFIFYDPDIPKPEPFIVPNNIPIPQEEHQVHHDGSKSPIDDIQVEQLPFI